MQKYTTVPSAVAPGGRVVGNQPSRISVDPVAAANRRADLEGREKLHRILVPTGCSLLGLSPSVFLFGFLWFGSVNVEEPNYTFRNLFVASICTVVLGIGLLLTNYSIKVHFEGQDKQEGW